jgi:ParB family chromosome partitioning protein
LTTEFLHSIRENGVLTPVTAVRYENGTVLVRTGQRRTLAAREVGLATIPVYIVPADGEDTATRIVEQLTENDHRAAMGHVDRVNAVQQLLLTGLSVTTVAKRLAVAPDRVKESRAVAGSALALESLRDRQMSLAEAAVLAEFDGDESAVETLLRAAGRTWFDHTAQRLRQARQDAEQAAAAARQWSDAGYTVLERRPTQWDANQVPLAYLTTVDGEPVDDSVVADSDPRWWAVFPVAETVFVDKATGETVAEETIDWATDDTPDAAPQAGMRHADSVDERDVWGPDWYCLDPAAARLQANARFVHAGAHADDAITDGPTADAVSDKDKAAAVRRRLLALNKLGQAAEVVRRQFVTNLLARKTPPRGASIFVAHMLASDGYLMTQVGGNELAVEFLGAAKQEYTRTERIGGVAGLVKELPESADGRAQVILLGLVLAALEVRTKKDSWRSGTSLTGRPSEQAEYLRFLAQCGYGLAPVEQIITGDTTADQVFAAIQEQ